MRVSCDFGFGPLEKAPQGIPELLSFSSLHFEPSLLPSRGPAGSQHWFLPLLSPNILGQEIFNTTGVVMIRNGSLVTASLDGTVIISVTVLSNILHASCNLPEEYRNHTEGLLGKKQAGP